MGATVLAAVLATLAVIGGTEAQRLFSGGCPQPPVQDDFNITKFMGTWYEVEKTGSLLQEGLRCVETEYSTEDGQLSIVTKGINTLGIDQTTRGEGNLDSTDPGKIAVRQGGLLPISTTYQILSTDYDNYAVVWSCVPLLGRIGHSETLWFLARDRNLGSDTKRDIDDAIRDLSVSRVGMRPTIQQNCS